MDEKRCPEGHAMKRRPGKGWYCGECHNRARREARAPFKRPAPDPEKFPCGHDRMGTNATPSGRCRECRRIYDQIRDAAQRAAEGREKRVFDPDWFPCGHPRTPGNLNSHNCCRVCQIERAAKYRKPSRGHKNAQQERERKRLLKQCVKEERADPKTAEYVRIIRRDPCSYCGGEAGTRDHIVPMTAGGPNHWENYTAACLNCNTGKNDKSLLSYLLDKMEMAAARQQRKTA